MTKVLIIGSKGFIGSNAVTYFRNKGFETWGCGISEMPDDKFYFQVERFLPDYNNIFKLEKFNLCINASGAPGVAFSLEQPQEDFRMNVSNAYALLNALRVFNPDCKFINLSSAAVYGNPISLPIRESDPLNPLSPYGYHKMMAEQLVNEFHKIFGLQTCSFRIFSAYGPGLKKQLFWDIYQKALAANGAVVTLFGTGDETRDFIYIDDVLDAIYTVFERNCFSGEVINLASGLETRIGDAAHIFLNQIDSNIKLVFNGSQKPGDPLHWKADISLLEKMDFKISTDLNRGLSLYNKWMQKEEKK